MPPVIPSSKSELGIGLGGQTDYVDYKNSSHNLQNPFLSDCGEYGKGKNGHSPVQEVFLDQQ